METINRRRRTKSVCDYPLCVGELLQRIARKEARRRRWKNRLKLCKDFTLRWRKAK